MKIIQFIYIAIGTLIMNAVISDTNYTHPLYSLEFKIYGTGAEIRLNDIPLLSHDAEGQTSAQKPIPESVINGENVLTIKSYPLKEDEYQYQNGAYIEATISVREKNAPINNSMPLLQLKLNPEFKPEKLLNGTIEELGNTNYSILKHDTKETLAQRSAEIITPYPRWAWQDGKTIENTQENFSSLLEVYKKIWNALNNGDIDKVKSYYSPAASEFATAYHYSDESEGHRIMNTGGLINDNDWKLGDLDKLLQKFDYRLDIFGNNKLVHIVDQKERSPIVYLNKHVKMLNIQTFGFYKNQNNEWVMIR